VREHMQGPCGPLRQRHDAPSLRCAQGAAPTRSETVNPLVGVVSDFPPSTRPARSSLQALLGGSPRRSGSLPLAGGRRVLRVSATGAGVCGCRSGMAINSGRC